MERAETNLVSCPVCSLFLREGISLKDHLQTHSKDKVIEALLKRDTLNPDNVESIVDLTANNNDDGDSTSVPSSENRVFAPNRNTVGVVPTTSTFVESSSNQIAPTTSSVPYDSQVNNIQFSSTINNTLINQPNVTNTCNGYTYHQFITNDGNIVLIPVYNVGPMSVLIPNNITPNSIVNSCVIVPQNAVQPVNVVTPSTISATDVFNSSVTNGNVCQNANVLVNESNSNNSASAPPNTAGTSENVDDEKETDEEVANIFDVKIRNGEIGEKRAVDDKADEKSDSLSVTSDSHLSSADDEKDENTNNNNNNTMQSEGRNELIPSAAVSVIRVRSDLNYESDCSSFHVDDGDGDEFDLNADTDGADSPNRRFSPVSSLLARENVKCDSSSSPIDVVESTKCDGNLNSSYDNVVVDKDSDGSAASAGQNQYDFVISNSDNAMEILPGPADESLENRMARRYNDQYILPNDEIPGNGSFASGSDYNFLGVRNSFLSSASLISSVNKTMFSDVDVYNSGKNETNTEHIQEDVIDSNIKNEGVIVNSGRSSYGGFQNGHLEMDEGLYGNVCENMDSAGSSRISPFNIQTDESMPPRGELSGQDSLSGAENSLWELQMQQRSDNFTSTPVVDKKDIEINLKTIIKDINRSKDLEVFTLTEPTKQEIEPIIEEVACSSSKSSARKKAAAQRVFICFYCRTKFDTWKKRQSHIADQHSEEDGLTIESLFGKRIKCKVETVAETKVEEPQTDEQGSQLQPQPMEEDSKDNLSSLTNCIICRICNDSFRSTIGLLKHLKLFHGIKKRSCVCPTCFVRFGSADEYQQHIQKVHPYECMTCGKKFYTRPGFMLHQKRHMKVKPYTCNDCDKSFVTKQKLEEHVNIHTGENPIKCELCEAQFKRYSNYQQHKKFLHLNAKRKVKDFMCHCGEVFHSKVKLLWHQEIHDEKPKQCPYCVERFVHASSLTRHIRKWHSETYVSGWTTKKKVKSLVRCPVCNAMFLHSSLQAHLKTHDDAKPFACNECSRSFRTKWNLQLHKWTHMSRSSKPFKCKLCVKAYVHKQDYEAHQRSHNNCRPYSCNVCGRQFIRKYNCVRHMREHQEPRAYKCNVCGKLFSRSYYLTEHEKVHTGEKPHVCHICGKTSATKSNHNKHVKMHNVVRESVNSES